MPGRKEKTPAFQQTTVLLRADIHKRARDEGIDISNTCNTALATILKIDYRQQRLDDVPVAAPVIVAKDGAAPGPAPTPRARAADLPPVINADDPKAAGVIARSRKPAATSPPQEKAGTAAPQKATPTPPAPQPPEKKPESRKRAAGPAGSAPKKATKRPAKADLLKTYVSAHIVREDTGDATIPKEELYALFSRWCREYKHAVPDAKSVIVALKTRFAFREKTVDGTPCWTHVRVK